MSNKPKLLDLFCGAGGAAMGYHQAGFDVTGVDINPQPRFPFLFIQGDAIEYCQEHGHEFDVIHASPPCQAHSSLKSMWNANTKHINLIPNTRDALMSTGRLWVIENVIGAPLVNPIMICGSAFGQDIRRHRLFESNVPLTSLGCNHAWQTPRFLDPDKRRKNLSSVVNVSGHPHYAGEDQLRRDAMGIDWMTDREITQAIPPSYTRFIGRQILKALEEVDE